MKKNIIAFIILIIAFFSNENVLAASEDKQACQDSFQTSNTTGSCNASNSSTSGTRYDIAYVKFDGNDKLKIGGYAFIGGRNNTMGTNTFIHFKLTPTTKVTGSEDVYINSTESKYGKVTYATNANTSPLSNNELHYYNLYYWACHRNKYINNSTDANVCCGSNVNYYGGFELEINLANLANTKYKLQYSLSGSATPTGNYKDFAVSKDAVLETSKKTESNEFNISGFTNEIKINADKVRLVGDDGTFCTAPDASSSLATASKTYFKLGTSYTVASGKKRIAAFRGTSDGQNKETKEAYIYPVNVNGNVAYVPGDLSEPIGQFFIEVNKNEEKDEDISLECEGTIYTHNYILLEKIADSDKKWQEGIKNGKFSHTVDGPVLFNDAQVFKENGITTFESDDVKYKSDSIKITDGKLSTYYSNFYKAFNDKTNYYYKDGTTYWFLPKSGFDLNPSLNEQLLINASIKTSSFSIGNKKINPLGVEFSKITRVYSSTSAISNSINNAEKTYGGAGSNYYDWYFQPAMYVLKYCKEEKPNDCKDETKEATCEQSDTGTKAIFHENEKLKTCTIPKENDSGFEAFNKDDDFRNDNKVWVFDSLNSSLKGLELINLYYGVLPDNIDSHEENVYTNLSCKENIDIELPTTKTVNAGSFFKLDNYTPTIKAKRTCVTEAIDFNRMKSVVEKIYDPNVKSYNTYIDFSEYNDILTEYIQNLDNVYSTRQSYGQQNIPIMECENITDEDGLVWGNTCHETGNYYTLSDPYAQYYQIEYQEEHSHCISSGEGPCTPVSYWMTRYFRYVYKTWHLPGYTGTNGTHWDDTGDVYWCNSKDGFTGAVGMIGEGYPDYNARGCQYYGLDYTYYTDNVNYGSWRWQYTSNTLQNKQSYNINLYKQDTTTWIAGDDKYYYTFEPEVKFSYDDKQNPFGSYVTFNNKNTENPLGKNQENNKDTSWVENMKRNGDNAVCSDQNVYYWDKNASEIDEYYSGGVSTEPIEDVIHLECTGKTCDKNQAKDQKKEQVNNSKYIKRVQYCGGGSEDNPNGYKYHLPIVYTIIPSGATAISVNSNTPKLILSEPLKSDNELYVDAVPVDINNFESKNPYKYRITISNLNDKLRSSDEVKKKNSDYDIEKRFESKNLLTNDAHTYTCNYNVINEIYLPPDNRNPTLTYFYRIVEPENINPVGRQLGYNWTSDKANNVREKMQEDANDYNTLMREGNYYEFTLTPMLMKSIRNYNNKQANKGGYSDWDLTCKDYNDNNGYHCYSAFLNCMVSDGQSLGLANGNQVANSCNYFGEGTGNIFKNYSSETIYKEKTQNEYNRFIISDNQNDSVVGIVNKQNDLDCTYGGVCK